MILDMRYKILEQSFWIYSLIFVNSVGSNQFSKISLFEGTGKALYLDTQAKNQPLTI